MKPRIANHWALCILKEERRQLSSNKTPPRRDLQVLLHQPLDIIYEVRPSSFNPHSARWPYTYVHNLIGFWAPPSPRSTSSLAHRKGTAETSYVTRIDTAVEGYFLTESIHTSMPCRHTRTKTGRPSLWAVRLLGELPSFLPVFFPRFLSPVL